MRREKIASDDEGTPDCVVDWKASPEEVIKEMDSYLQKIGYEIVLYETGDDSIAWSVFPIVGSR